MSGGKEIWVLTELREGQLEDISLYDELTTKKHLSLNY